MKKVLSIILFTLLLASCKNIEDVTHTMVITSVTTITPDKYMSMSAYSFTDKTTHVFYVNKGWGGSSLILAMSNDDIGRYISVTRTHNNIDGFSWNSMGFIADEYVNIGE